jgi:hypothetical protein
MRTTIRGQPGPSPAGAKALPSEGRDFLRLLLAAVLQELSTASSATINSGKGPPDQLAVPALVSRCRAIDHPSVCDRSGSPSRAQAATRRLPRIRMPRRQAAPKLHDKHRARGNGRSIPILVAHGTA